MQGPAGLAFFARVVAALHAGHAVTSRVAAFHVIVFPGYEGRNPRTGAVVPVPPKRALFFVAGDELGSAALGARQATRFADGEARVRDLAQENARAPSTEVACSDDELRDVAQAIASLVGAPLGSAVDVPNLGTLALVPHGDTGGFRIVLDVSDDARRAIDEARTPPSA